MYCRCELSLYFKVNNVYHILSNNDNDKLNYTIYNELHLIKVKAECDCQLKKYKKFMTISKFALITKLKLFEENNSNNSQIMKDLEKYKKNYEELNKKNLYLQKEVEKLGKLEEIKNHGAAKFEDFYDIVIHIVRKSLIITKKNKIKKKQKKKNKKWNLIRI